MVNPEINGSGYVHAISEEELKEIHETVVAEASVKFIFLEILKVANLNGTIFFDQLLLRMMDHLVALKVTDTATSTIKQRNRS